MYQPDKDLEALFKGAYDVALYIDTPANTYPAQHSAVTANIDIITPDRPNDIVMSTQNVDEVAKRFTSLQKFVQLEKLKRFRELEPELESLKERL